MKDDPNTKRGAISKANAQMVIIVAISAFVVVFSLFLAKALLSQNNYQGRVTTEKTKARNVLKENLAAYDQLAKSYSAFNATSTNVIGGTPNGNGDKDGINSKITLDALPANYDFPALASSIEKIVSTSGLKMSAITGTDDQLNQQNNQSASDPKEVEMPFSFSVSDANYTGIKQVISNLQLSIRPMVIDSIEISGGVNNMSMTVNAHTYFKPAKDVSITKKVEKKKKKTSYW